MILFPAISHAMEQHCKQCESEGRYAGKWETFIFGNYSDLEAELAKNRLRQLKEQEFGIEYQNLAIQHQQRQDEIQNEHLQQYNDFNRNYDMEFTKASEED